MKQKRPRRPQLPFGTAKLKKTLLSALFALAFALAAWIHESDTPTRVPAEDHPIELYANQSRDDLTTTFTSAICSAEHSVTLLIYSLTDPSIISCLNKKCAEGVPVHVVCDATGSPEISKKLNENITLIRRFGPGLMHQKILVIDNEKTWLGSANMTTESLRLHGNLVHAIHSRHFAETIMKKASAMQEEGKAPPVREAQFRLGGQEVELWFLPENKRASVRIKDLIRQATKTLKVAMFTWTRYDFANTVIDAAKRGVQTEVVIDRKQGMGSGAAIVKLLKDNNINVSLSEGNALLHHKFLYIDGDTLVNGSANWTKRAFTQNDDCFIVVHDLTMQQNQQMDALWSSIKRESIPVH